MKKQTLTATDLVRALDHHRAMTLYGQQGLVVVRRAIEHVLTQAGYAITFDPVSSPDLVDYLTVSTVSGLKGAAVGAGLGTLVGLLFGRPALGATLGAGLGGFAGTGRGIQRVKNGWRVRAVREISGRPIVAIKALKAA
jgi:hypothetical protein